MKVIPCLLVFLPLLASSGVNGEICRKATCRYRWRVLNTLSMYTGGESALRLYAENGTLYYAGFEADPAHQASEEHISQTITADGNYRDIIAIQDLNSDTPDVAHMPGPTIEVLRGARVVVDVENAMFSGAMSIHWHGMFQRGTPFMDGVGMVSHCPIQPGQSFRYTFVADPSGTFWYHGHTGVQRTEGLFGALIVHDEEAIVEQTDGEFVMSVLDWFPHNSKELVINDQEYENGLKKPAYSFLNSFGYDGFAAGRSSPFHTALINGKGRVFEADGGDNGAPVEIFNVDAGSSYRFRVIGAQGQWAVRVSVDGHPLKIVAIDGFEIKATVAESFILNGGERFDFVIEANQPAGNYWVRVETFQNEWADTTLPLCNQALYDANKANGVYKRCPYRQRSLAVLRYGGAPTANPTTTSQPCTATSRCRVLNCPFKYFPRNFYSDCINIASMERRDRTSEEDQVPRPRRLTVGERLLGRRISRQTEFLNIGFQDSTSINGKMHLSPVEPPQTQAYRYAIPRAQRCPRHCNNTNDPGCTCTHTVSLASNAVVDLIFTNAGQDGSFAHFAPHPIHIHGHSFHVMATGYAKQNVTADTATHQGPATLLPDVLACLNPPHCTQMGWGTNGRPAVTSRYPIRKDTILIPAGGFAWLRLKADNVGWWMVHCHIEPHQVEGMALILDEGSPLEMPIPPPHFPTCMSFPRGQRRHRHRNHRENLLKFLPPILG